jgi:hypothetical protein
MKREASLVDCMTLCTLDFVRTPGLITYVVL